MNNSQTTISNFELIEAQSAYMKTQRRKIHRRTVRTLKSIIRQARKDGNVRMEMLFINCLRIYRTGYDL